MAALKVKLGKLAPKADPRTLRLAKYIGPALPPPPDAVDNAAVVEKVLGGGNWGVMENDAIGDCTIAAAAHLTQAWTAAAGKIQTIADVDIVRAYSAVSGYNPKTGANDNGAVEIEVLNYWRRKGIGGHKICGYARLDPANNQHVRQAVAIFDGCYIGLALPVSAQHQMGADGGDDVWDVPAGGPTGEGRPGSWGGHAVCVVGYDAEGLTIVTWGQTKRMTWNFWTAYCDESYAILSADMLVEGKSPAGIDAAQLAADLKAVTG
ncbi:MAG TPA: hypothetical protein VHQ47_17735 [Phycisphaerae bacterium]|nr:hypothetical protein [Phycisphaerae bacterium]